MKPFPITVVGASLGGLAAVETILGNLPASIQTSIIVVQHRLPDTESRLSELLAEHSALPVSEVDDKEPIAIGKVYLAPSNYHLLVDDGFFSLSVDAPVCFVRPSIDVLFESAADVYGAAAIGVVLTGSNSDGAAGAAAIKSAGGCVLVQNPASAESPVAPRAVLEATQVDGVLELPQIAARIVELSSKFKALRGTRGVVRGGLRS